MNNYNNLPDVQLVGLLENSDDAAFIEIFERYYILLFSFTIRRLNDKAISKDLIHDAFASIWENRETINIQGELIAFLFTEVKNHILDHYKRKKITQEYAESFQPYLDQIQNAANSSVRPKDIKTLIEEEIAALPEEMRIAFELRRKSAMIVL